MPGHMYERLMRISKQDKGAGAKMHVPKSGLKDNCMKGELTEAPSPFLSFEPVHFDADG